jgi:hypothetical protein
MKIPKDGKVCKDGWWRWFKSDSSPGYSAYERAYVYTIFPDKTALIEYGDGRTKFVNADDVIWNCCCASRILFREGCQCGGE